MIKALEVSETSKLAPVRRFLASDRMSFLLMLLSLLVIITNQYMYGIVGAVFLSALIMLLTDDAVSMFMPVLYTSAFIIQNKNSYDAFMTFMPVWIFAVVCMVLHFVVYPPDLHYRMGRLKLPMILIAFTVFLGGVGIIDPAEYFAGVSVGHMFALGILPLLLYWLLGQQIRPGRNYTDRLDLRFSKMCCWLVLYLFLAVVEYYVEHFAEFAADPGILPFQWRNNACTMIMMAMPFTFYMGTKHFRNFIFPLLGMIAIVFSGSRGGLVFGTLEFGMLLIYFGIVDKRHRKLLLGFVGAGVLALLCLLPKLIPFMSYTLGRFTDMGENYIRIMEWKRSVEDFLANPIFGRGLGYMGNRDIHESAEGVLCYYHSSLPQIWGSFGILGLLTYGYQFICRLRLMLSKKSLFAKAILWSFIGLELMSLVNPGVFSPLYLTYLTVLLIIDENYDFPQTIDGDLTLDENTDHHEK